MKKTIITLLATCACAMGATETFDPAVKSGTIAIALDIEELAKISDVSFDGGSEVYQFFAFNGTWHDGNEGYIGLVNNGSSTSDNTGLYCTWKYDAQSKTNHDIGLGGIFTSSTNWDNIDAITLVYSYNTPDSGATTTNIALSISYLDGSEIGTFSATKSDLKFGGTSGFAAKSLTINDTYADSYTFENNFISLDDAKALSVSMLSVPEPTTATLSLLALAGLAARRRRK